MGKKNDYRNYLKNTLGGIVDRLDISELRKEFLKNRWLDQLMWLEGRATKERNRHHTLRMITIVGGVLVPALISFRSPGEENQRFQNAVGWTALGLSQIVAVSAAVEEFFGHGDKYRDYRNTAEGMKIEGWQFFQLSGPYHQFETHSEAYTAFANRVEQYIQQDVQGFLARLDEKQDEDKLAAKEAQLNAEAALRNVNVQLERAQQLEERRQLEERQRLAHSSDGDASEPVANGTAAPNGLDPLKGLPPLGAAAMPWEEEVDLDALRALVNQTKPVANGNGAGQRIRSGNGAVASVPQLATAEEVSQVLECPLEDCRKYLPGILAALQDYDILDKHVLIGMLATIRVETSGMKPVHEWGGGEILETLRRPQRSGEYSPRRWGSLPRAGLYSADGPGKLPHLR